MKQRTTRRAVLSGGGAAIAGFAMGSTNAAAQAPATSFRPARHQQDEWLDRIPGRHRTFIDCATVAGAGEGMLYANNLYVANRNGYQLNENDVAVVVCLRHFATVFAHNDAIWGKAWQGDKQHGTVHRPEDQAAADDQPAQLGRLRDVVAEFRKHYRLRSSSAARISPCATWPHISLRSSWARLSKPTRRLCTRSLSRT